MKPEEAIEELRKLRPRGGIIPQKRAEMIDFAISALKEVQQYRKIGTVEECRKAVEKQRTKKIIIESYCPTECPTCGYELSTSLGDGYYKHPTFLERCPNCGQEIYWEESEEE